MNQSEKRWEPKAVTSFALVLTSDSTLTEDGALRLAAAQFRHVQNFLSVDGVTDATMSAMLKIQLGWMSNGYPCAFSGIVRSFDVRAISEAITSLEKRSHRSEAKPAEQFTGTLQGFWKAHWFEASLWPGIWQRN